MSEVSWSCQKALSIASGYISHTYIKQSIHPSVKSYFVFHPHEVRQQTTELAKSPIHYPMQRPLKNRFQMLRHKKLNEVIAKHTYFAITKSIEDYHCAHYFWNDL
jgi:hypothetical protein